MPSLPSRLPLRRILQLSCLAALVSGCFQDVDDPTMTPPTCTAGTLGCECANGLCGEDLTCSPTADICMPVDCELGTIFCGCDAGRCDPMLSCTLGACAPEVGGSGVDPTTSSSTTGGPTTMTGPTTLTSSSTMTDTTTSTTTSTTDPDTTAADTTADATESGSSSTGGAVDCNENGTRCGDCFACAEGSSDFCATEYDACQAITGCGAVRGCLAVCGTTGNCIENCCDGVAQSVIDAAFDVFNCQRDNCINTACVRIEEPFCE